MLNRLEKAVAGSHKLHFNDFLKFICQPDQMTLNSALKDLQEKRAAGGHAVKQRLE